MQSALFWPIRGDLLTVQHSLGGDRHPMGKAEGRRASCVHDATEYSRTTNSLRLGGCGMHGGQRANERPTFRFTARGLVQDSHRTAFGAPPFTTSDPLAALLDNLRQRLAIDPFGNPIQLLALEITGRLDRRESNAEDLAQSVARLTADAFSDRAARLGTYLGETDPAVNEHAIHDILSRLAVKGDFEKFRALVEKVAFGVVFTAHPAFTIHHELALALAELATGTSHDGEPLGQGGRERRMALAVGATHRPENALTLEIEHAWSLEALRHAHDALERIHRIAFRIARERWPQQWTRLTPRLISLASWVGYDQDGRTDLTWMGAIGKRLEDKQAALERHRASVEALQRNVRAGLSTRRWSRSHRCWPPRPQPSPNRSRCWPSAPAIPDAPHASRGL